MHTVSGRVLSSAHFVVLRCALPAFFCEFRSCGKQRQRERQRKTLIVRSCERPHHFLCLQETCPRPQRPHSSHYHRMRAFVLPLLLATCFSLCAAGGPEKFGPLSADHNDFIRTDGCTVTATNLICENSGNVCGLLPPCYVTLCVFLCSFGWHSFLESRSSVCLPDRVFIVFKVGILHS